MTDILKPVYGQVWATTGEKLSPDSTKVDRGWVQEMMPYQWENFLQNRQDVAITYILQKGIPEWSSDQEYIENKSVVSYGGQLYMATSTVTNVLPTVAASWKKMTVSFDSNGTIPIALGGTGAVTAANARTNLGIGTIALQAANAVSISGGVINSTPIGATTPSTGKFTDIEATGTLTASSIIGPVTGNASSATKLATPRTVSISGAVTGTPTNFDGSANIEIPITTLNVGAATVGVLAVNRGGTGVTTSTGTGDNVQAVSPTLTGTPTVPTAATGTNSLQIANMAAVQAVNSSDTGSAATALKLKTARTIGGVSFDGTSNINLPGVNIVGTQDTSGSAATLTTHRTFALSGAATGTATSFNGSANITIPVTALNGSNITAGNIPAARMSAFGVIKDSATGSASLPSGPTASRGAAAVGKIRHNTDSDTYEAYYSTGWALIGSNGTKVPVTTKSTRFKATLDLMQKDPYLLLQGDSTGNEDWEFFFLTVQKLCADYPTHTVYYRTWNTTTLTWEGRTLQTGTSARVLRIYNGSVPGATPAYWQGTLKDYAYDGFQFDMVIVNYGLNVSTDAIIQKSSLSAYLYTLKSEQPNAEIVFNIQCPDYTDAVLLSRSQMRSDAQRQIVDEYGVASVDVFSKFSELVNSSTVESWYGDRIHPNPAGQAVWSELLYPHLFKTAALPRSYNTAPTLVPNGNFSRWYQGYPVWWAWNTTNIVFKDTSSYETGDSSVRVEGVGENTGIFFLQIPEAINRLKNLPQIVVAARVRTTGSTSKPGTLMFSTGSVATSDYKEYYSEGNGFQGVSSGRWRWVFLVLPQEVYKGKSNLFLGVLSGQAGERVLIDRVLWGGSILLPDSNGSDSFSADYSYSDASFTVAANSTQNRQIDNTGRGALRLGTFSTIGTPSPLPAGVIVTGQVINDTTFRVSFTNITGASVTIPSGLWQIKVE